MHYILGGPDGRTPEPCKDLGAWSAWMSSGNRQVGFTHIGTVVIGTAFVGIAERFSGERPILFETLVTGDDIRLPREEYCTWAEAEAGHARRVAQVARIHAFPEPLDEHATGAPGAR